jgi:hypothetical protein
MRFTHGAMAQMIIDAYLRARGSTQKQLDGLDNERQDIAVTEWIDAYLYSRVSTKKQLDGLGIE